MQLYKSMVLIVAIATTLVSAKQSVHDAGSICVSFPDLSRRSSADNMISAPNSPQPSRKES
jgi:hypothetical protein